MRGFDVVVEAQLGPWRKDAAERWARTPRATGVAAPEPKPSGLVASIWWCGDEWCDCTEPRIELITPGRTKMVWQGTSMADTCGASALERLAQYVELRDACERKGVEFPEDLADELAGWAGIVGQREGEL
jgi:hypothetical protein